MKLILFICLVHMPVFMQAQVIVTVAGTGMNGYSGDGGPSTNALLSDPTGVFIDDSGNVIFCDHSTIRKIKPAYGGIISTVAGLPTSGYSGENIPAVYAEINGVRDIFVDHKGNMYLPDAGNNRLRKVDKSGIIKTIAGTGVAGYNGDGIPATSAQLNSPYGVAVDDTGNVYIADKYNYRIRKIDTFGVIWTVCGTGVAGFSNDGGYADTSKISYIGSVRLNKSGELIIGDNARLRKIGINGILTTIAGSGTLGYTGDGGPATAANIGGGMFGIDTSGNLYLSDVTNSIIRKINTVGIITTIAGSAGSSGYFGDGGSPLTALLSSPSGVAINNQGDVFIGDLANNRIRMITNHPIEVNNTDATGGQNISISPNPATDQFAVTFTTNFRSSFPLIIRDINGREVDKLMIRSNEPLLFPSCLPPGIYVFSVISGGQTFSTKLHIK
jgi:hypothetical protein